MKPALRLLKVTANPLTIMKNNLRDLYLQQLQQLLSSESQAIDYLRAASMKATDQDLKEALSEHLQETKTQQAKLQQLLVGHPSVSSTDYSCEATRGLLKEAQCALTEKGEAMVLDAQLIVASRGLESYEVTAYTSAISMAEALNEKADAKVLHSILKEEQAAAEKLEHLLNGGFFSAGLAERIIEQ